MISEWVRSRVVERLGLDPDRVHAVHLGVDHERFTPDPPSPREPFLYYPARPWPHKNHARLFEAFARVRETRSGAAARAHRRGPGAARAARRRRGARRRPARPSGRPLPARRGARLPEPVRGVRATAASRRWRAAARRLLERRLAARGRRRRGGAVRPPEDPAAIAAGVSRRSTAPRSSAALGLGARRGLHLGRDRARPRPGLRTRRGRRR